MLNNFSKHDRRLLLFALLLLCTFSYLLFDDSFLMDFMIGHGRPIASLARTENDVRQKYASDFRWIPVSKAIVHENDSVFTGPNSEALVVLPDGSEIHLKENTLVTFRTVNGQLVLGLKFGSAETKGKVEIIREKPRQPSSVVMLPKIISPETNGKKIVPLDLYGKKTIVSDFEVKWTYEKENVQFELQVGKDADFENLEFTQITPATEQQIPEVTDGTYYIRVRELLDEKTFGKWSRVTKFSIQLQKPEALPRPKLLTKEIHLKGDEKNLAKIAWSKVEGALTYELQLTEDTDFKNFETFKTKKNKIILEDKQLGFYQFRVVARGEMNLQSPPSDAGQLSITTQAPILSPVKAKKYIPKNEKDMFPTPVTFDLKWAEPNKAATYLVQISPDAEFTQPMQYESKGKQRLIRIENTGKYYWRVRSLASTGKAVSAFSKPGEILYSMEKPLAPPQLLEPNNDMTLFFQKKSDTPFYLVWSKAPNATLYTLEIATDTKFKSVIVQTQLSERKYLFREKLPQGELYWRVRAEAPERLSPWSRERKFSVFSGRNARGQ
jgi:hypothetical protein